MLRQPYRQGNELQSTGQQASIGRAMSLNRQGDEPLSAWRLDLIGWAMAIRPPQNYTFPDGNDIFSCGMKYFSYFCTFKFIPI
jgi:hypothetical protein